MIAFLILAAVVYFVIVKPYTAATNRYFADQPVGQPADVALLTKIRDLLAQASTARTRSKPPA